VIGWFFTSTADTNNLVFGSPFSAVAAGAVLVDVVTDDAESCDAVPSALPNRSSDNIQPATASATAPANR
jgi:hypothetical protein